MGTATFTIRFDGHTCYFKDSTHVQKCPECPHRIGCTEYYDPIF